MRKKWLKSDPKTLQKERVMIIFAFFIASKNDQLMALVCTFDNNASKKKLSN